HVRIDDRQAYGRVGARRGIDGKVRDPGRPGNESIDCREVGVRAGNEAIQPADRLRPFERVDIVFDAQHRWRVDRLALEDAFDQLAALRHAEDFWQRPGGRIALETLYRARAEDQHPVPTLAAQNLLPGEGDDIELFEIEALCE